ncbi:MAG: adenylate kinase [Candidatus Binatota bacterium]|nr:adenylate kinase [Candidatus Binatota bacterium]
MRLVLLGAPGVGKGTQAKLLHDRLGLPPISTGEILRAAAQSGSPLGQEASDFMERGDLVPDDVIIRVVEERLRDPDCRKGFLLDGFPRTLPQAEALDAMLGRQKQALDAAISLAVPRDEVLSRLAGRRTCKDCGAMYNLTLSPPRAEGVCDRCGDELYQRNDDGEETIRARLEVYERETAPLHDYYRRRSLLREVDGSGTTGEVHSRVLGALGVPE